MGKLTEEQEREVLKDNITDVCNDFSRRMADLGFKHTVTSINVQTKEVTIMSACEHNEKLTQAFKDILSKFA